MINKTALLGAAFLMATSAIGPGFLTQTATFTGSLLASFGFVILVSIILDIGAQLNIWRIIGISGKRGTEVANMVLPNLGYFVAFNCTRWLFLQYRKHSRSWAWIKYSIRY